MIHGDILGERARLSPEKRRSFTSSRSSDLPTANSMTAPFVARACGSSDAAW
jgi:hypothetical protein